MSAGLNVCVVLVVWLHLPHPPQMHVGPSKIYVQPLQLLPIIHPGQPFHFQFLGCLGSSALLRSCLTSDPPPAPPPPELASRLKASSGGRHALASPPSFLPSIGWGSPAPLPPVWPSQCMRRTHDDGADGLWACVLGSSETGTSRSKFSEPEENSESKHVCGCDESILTLKINSRRSNAMGSCWSSGTL